MEIAPKLATTPATKQQTKIILISMLTLEITSNVNNFNAIHVFYVMIMLEFAPKYGAHIMVKH